MAWVHGGTGDVVRESVKLTALQPSWQPVGPDWGGGVCFVCPTHSRHLLVLLFHLGMGGWDGPEGQRLHTRYGDSWCDLTLLEPIDFGPCFRGRLIDGELVWG